MNFSSHILFSFIIMISCQSKEKADFSFVPPNDWTIIDTTQPGRERFVLMHPSLSDSTPVVEEGITIGVNHFLSVDLYIKQLFDRIKGEVFYFEEVGNGSMKKNSHKITWQQYKIQKDSTSKLYEQKTFFIESEEAIYEITCTAKPGGIYKMETKIDTVLMSFKMH